MSSKKLRVLHLFENYLLTAQNWAFRMMDNFEETENFVCAYKYRNVHFVTDDIHLLELPDYVTPEIISESRNVSSSHGSNVLSFFKKKYYQSKFINYVASEIKRLQIDVIHCHFANIGWHFLPLKKITGLPFIVSFYGFDYESLPYSFPVWKRRYQQMFKDADMFICEGPHGAEILKKYGCAERKIKVVHLGVDFAKAPSISRFKNPDELSLIQIGNLGEKKGHIYSLKAFAKALKECPNMNLTLIGDGYQNIRESLEKFVAEHHLADKVHFEKHVPSYHLYEILKIYQVFIHPSCYAENRDCEGGAPIVLLDAQATGMPVISTNHCDIPEEVIHNKTGLLSGEKDVDALAESITYFYKMKNNEYVQFAQNAREHVHRNFDVENTSKKMEAVYFSIKGKKYSSAGYVQLLAAASAAAFIFIMWMRFR